MSETATVETLLDALCEVAAVLTEAELHTAQTGIRQAVGEPMAGLAAGTLETYWHALHRQAESPAHPCQD